MTAQAIITGRLLQFAGISVLFGSSMFYVYGLAAAASEQFSRSYRWPRMILIVATLAGIAGVAIWVMGQTASISDQPRDAFDPTILLGILTETHFGRVCLLRLALLAACLILLWRRASSRLLWLCVALLSGAAVASFAWTGHGIKDEGLPGLVHLAGDLLHLFTAAIWLGALVPLVALIGQSLQTEKPLDAVATYEALESFSAIGVAVVGVLIFSGIINSWFLIGWQQAGALLTTTYGIALILKLILFGLMLVLAANNRYRLTLRLTQGIESHRTPTEALRALRQSLLMETTLALLVLGAVAFLGTLDPPISSLGEVP
jgi:putative copper resistance protein D